MEEVVNVLQVIEIHLVTGFNKSRSRSKIRLIVAWFQSEGFAEVISTSHTIVGMAHAIGFYLRPFHLTGGEKVGIQFHLDTAWVEEIERSRFGVV